MSTLYFFRVMFVVLLVAIAVAEKLGLNRLSNYLLPSLFMCAVVGGSTLFVDFIRYVFTAIWG